MQVKETVSTSTNEEKNTINQSYELFEHLNLKPNLLRGIYGHGFEKPSFIQQKGIIPLISKRDTIAQAQSGTGKTATFAIGILQNIDEQVFKVQALVVAPTRELASQIRKEIEILGEYLKIKVHLCIGGTKVKDDKKALEDGVHVVVGTPGRMLDLLTRNFLESKLIQMIIFDEADVILGHGFQEEIGKILQSLPGDIQIGLFSATMPPEIIKITKEVMRDPAMILVKNEELTLEGIQQFFVTFEKEEYKFDTLCALFNSLSINQCIIYCCNKRSVEELTKRLKEKNFIVSCIHGEMMQCDRELIMKEFRMCTSRVLVSTDLLSRGIDVQGVNLVINFEPPKEKETYLHRIGRTGRFGRRGIAINFVTVNDSLILKDLEKFYNTQIEELPEDLGTITYQPKQINKLLNNQINLITKQLLYIAKVIMYNPYQLLHDRSRKWFFLLILWETETIKDRYSIINKMEGGIGYKSKLILF